jgi:His-Xaa-Ser system protein HxsD
MDLIQKLEDGRLALKVNKSIFHQESILSAMYKFTHNCYIHIDSLDSDYYSVIFAAKHSSIDLVSEASNFCNELIDQEIRYNLDNSNKSIKQLIIKKAFFPFQSDE